MAREAAVKLRAKSRGNCWGGNVRLKKGGWGAIRSVGSPKRPWAPDGSKHLETTKARHGRSLNATGRESHSFLKTRVKEASKERDSKSLKK